MIHSFLMVAAMIQPIPKPPSLAPPLLLEINSATIKLDFSKIKIDKIENVSDCVYISWRKGHITHREALQTLARLACVDTARVKGRPLSFHGDSWVSTGHWSKVITDVIFIYTKGTKDISDSDRIKLLFIEKGLAHRISDKFGERTEFEKKSLTTKQVDRLIRCVQELEKMVEKDPRFDEREPLDESHSSDGCEDSISIKMPQ
ncbi:hypothetical protein [Geothrix sp. 21YS21S-4]|uniref:hypothetical protein n=1 Tax=Geothrix sp. 21YS21S-4 TaxID=3068889 RepID=UPI0027B8C1D6|nr:hypothetical protein [Geothrix sp. 21YS21S-4]